MRTTRETAVAIRTEHLIARYRGVICDLDGVVYWGTAAVPGAVDTLNHVVADGRAVAFATNNASRSPIAVAKHLRELGVGGRGWSVITSSQAAAASRRWSRAWGWTSPGVSSPRSATSPSAG